MANRCYQLAIDGLLLDSYRQTVLHFQSTGTADNDTLAAGESLVAAFAASAMANFLATLPASYVITQLSARRVDLKPSAVAKTFYGVSSHVGTRGTDATANQTCPSVFLVPVMGVKSGGKIFWPAVPQGDLVQNVPATSWVTVIDSFIAGLISGISNAGITWTLAVFSRKLQTISNVTNHSLSPVVGYQSKRRKPVGAT